MSQKFTQTTQSLPFSSFFVALTKYTQYYEVEDNPLFDEGEYDKQTSSRNCKLSRNNKRNV